MADRSPFSHGRVWTAVVPFLTALFLASACCAETLYERSLEMLSAQEKTVSPEKYTFVVLGDSRDDDLVFRRSLELAATFKPLFILHDGDYSRSGSPEETDHFLGMVRAAVPAIPFFVVKGNHEQEKVFREKIGPLDYVIDDARIGFKLIVVDNSGYALKSAQLDYLKKQLETKQKMNFISMHVPPRTKRWDWHTFSEGAPELIRLLSEKQVTAAFYGHVHIYDHDVLGGVPHVITGGAGAPLITTGVRGKPVYHIVVVEVNNGSVSYRMVEVGK